MPKHFHLSVVATTRNDNHGESLLSRMQHFVDGFVEQCKRHRLKAELILVEWNPPEDKLPLAKALNFPAEKGPCAIRIIRVPNDVHAQLDHSDKIPLFQMLGKNVGIKRSKGQFVLATNIDILFSDELIIFIRDQIKPGILYRVDRLDIPQQLPKMGSFDEVLHYCSENVLRIHGKFGSRLSTKFNYSNLMKPFFFSMNLLRKMIKRISRLKKNAKERAYPISLKELFLFSKHLFGRILDKLAPLHTNACGDFILLSYEDWARLRGHPEWNIYSWHLDSVLLYQAKHSGIREVDLPKKMPIYHIEHSLGSGYTPEGSHLLFKRLTDNGIPYLQNSDLEEIVCQMRTSKQEVMYNHEEWGMSSLEFEEFWV
jgi:hypothetical protein